MKTRILAVLGLGLSLSLGACAGEKPTAASAGSDEAPAAASADQASAAAPATGNVIEVKMVTDDKGNYFEPKEIHAKRGDVLRFTLVSGVHNVSFAQSNPGKSGLPGPSEMLQLPGQTHDVTVDMPAGEYKFQCDPHAALGMVGELEVE